jgi:hypothetical protein
MLIYQYEPINLEKINTYELSSRPSKVTIRDFAQPISADDSLKSFLDKLPDILAVRSIREHSAKLLSPTIQEKII